MPYIFDNFFTIVMCAVGQPLYRKITQMVYAWIHILKKKNHENHPFNLLMKGWIMWQLDVAP